MNILCTAEFKSTFDKLRKNNSYSTLEADIAEYFASASPPTIYSGINLNQSTQTPYIKKRLSGKGGFRIYFFAIVRDNTLILVFVHPKTGTMGDVNISDTNKKLSLKQGIEALEQKRYYTLSIIQNTIHFQPSEAIILIST